MDVTVLVQIEAGLSDSGFKNQKKWKKKKKEKTMPDWSLFFKITLDQIKLYTLYSRGKEWWIYTHQNAHFCLFSPKKSVKDIPFTASTFTNVQLYRRNKSNTTNLEQGLSNTTTRHVFFFFLNWTNNLTLINCTYTTCILQLFIWSKEAITMSITGEV